MKNDIYTFFKYISEASKIIFFFTSNISDKKNGKIIFSQKNNLPANCRKAVAGVRPGQT